jgi:hypothetical protein
MLKILVLPGCYQEYRLKTESQYLNIAPDKQILKDIYGRKNSPPPSAAGQRRRGQKGEKRINDQSAVLLQPAVVRGSHAMVTAGAGTISFLQKGQNAVATFLSSIMDSALKDISNRVDPG